MSGLRNGHDILIIGPRPGKGYQGGVPTHVQFLMELSVLRNADCFDAGSVNSNLHQPPMKIITRLLRLPFTLQRQDYSVILINASLYASSFAKLLFTLLLLRSRFRRRSHVFFHGGNPESLRPFTVFPVRKLVLRVMSQVACSHFLSESQRGAFLCFFPLNKTELYVNYGSSDGEYTGDQRSHGLPLRLLFVGRIQHRKGIFDLVDAVGCVMERKPGSVQLTIAGEGEESEDLLQRLKNIPGDAIHFKGWLDRSSLEALYAESDLLVLPSYAEAFPYVVVEAMRAGLPIVATPVGALDMLIKEGVTGWKIPPGDVKTLVATLIRVVNERAGLRTMSERCRAFYMEKLSRRAAEAYYGSLCRQAPPSFSMSSAAEK